MISLMKIFEFVTVETVHATACQWIECSMLKTFKRRFKVGNGNKMVVTKVGVVSFNLMTLPWTL